MTDHHVFPWWAGYFLLNPLRKINLNPEKLLSVYIRPGMKIIDAGCAMGFFSLPMARLTGSEGRVICIDPQKKMLDTLKKRAARTGVSEIIDARLCTYDSLLVMDLHGQIDLAFAFGVLHETRDKKKFIAEICSTLRSGSVFIFGEPHVVTQDEFSDSIALVEEYGLAIKKIMQKGNNKIAVMSR